MISGDGAHATMCCLSRFNLMHVLWCSLNCSSRLCGLGTLFCSPRLRLCEDRESSFNGRSAARKCTADHFDIQTAQQTNMFPLLPHLPRPHGTPRILQTCRRLLNTRTVALLTKIRMTSRICCVCAGVECRNDTHM